MWRKFQPEDQNDQEAEPGAHPNNCSLVCKSEHPPALLERGKGKL